MIGRRGTAATGAARPAAATAVGKPAATSAPVTGAATAAGPVATPARTAASAAAAAAVPARATPTRQVTVAAPDPTEVPADQGAASAGSTPVDVDKRWWFRTAIGGAVALGVGLCYGPGSRLPCSGSPARWSGDDVDTRTATLFGG